MYTVRHIYMQLLSLSPNHTTGLPRVYLWSTGSGIGPSCVMTAAKSPPAQYSITTQFLEKVMSKRYAPQMCALSMPIMTIKTTYSQLTDSPTHSDPIFFLQSHLCLCFTPLEYFQYIWVIDCAGSGVLPLGDAFICLLIALYCSIFKLALQ